VEGTAALSPRGLARTGASSNLCFDKALDRLPCLVGTRKVLSSEGGAWGTGAGGWKS